MELLKGLDKSKNKNKVLHGSWVDARNIVLSDEYRDVTNEEGFTLKETKTGQIIGRITTNDSIIVFSTDNTIGEIGIYDVNCNYTCILRSDLLNFNINNPIEGVFTRNARNEIVIVWWDGLDETANPPKILNIDCLPFEVNGNCEPVDPSKIDLLKLFPDIGCSDFTLESVNNTGGSLVTGVYAFTYAYVLPDGSITAHSGISNWVNIIKSLDSVDFINYDGNEANLPTSKSITLSIDNLNQDYTEIQIGVIKKIGNIISTATIGNFPIIDTTVEFDYTGLSEEIEVAPEILLTPFNSFTRVKSGTILDNRLTFGNVKTQQEIDYQCYANNIKVNWYRDGDDINLATNKNSYKDPILLFDRKSFSEDNVYAFYIVFKLKDGTYSRAFHIPNIAPQAVSGYGTLKENDLISDFNSSFPEDRFTQALIVKNDAKYHEIFSTADSNGKMGYWENQGETYPNEDCSDIKDNTGSIIGTLRGEKVRHHRFPNLKQLKDWGRNFYEASTGSPTSRLWEFDADGFNSSGDNDRMDYSQVSGSVTNFTVNQTTDGLYLTATAPVSGNLRVGYNFSGLTVDIRLEVFLVKASGTGQTLYVEEYTDPSLLTPKQADFNFNKFLNLNTGDQLQITVTIISNVIITQPTIDGSNIYFDADNIGDSDGTTKALGVRFSDIHVPDEIKDSVDCMYFGYATREIKNQLRVAHSRFERDDLVQSIYNFDVLLIEPPINPNYIKTHYRYTSTDSNLLFNNSFNAEQVLRPIEEFSYLPAGVITEYNGFRFDLEDKKHSVLAAKITSALTNELYFGGVYQYKTDLYNSYDSQRIVIIPKRHNVNNSQSDVLYSGDVVINPVGFFANRVLQARYEIHETASTVGYRYEQPLLDEYYYPKLPNTTFGDTYNYNLDYNSLNNLLPILIAKCVGECNPLRPNNNAPFTIARSIVQSSESANLGFRQFLTNEYYVMRDKTKGEIWKVMAMNKTLLIYQKYSMFIAHYRDVIYSQDVETYLGTGDIFDRLPDEVVSDQHGYVGNQSQWCTFLCKHGAIHIDTQQGKVFLYNGELQELSNKQMRQWFYEQRDLLEQTDNPFDGTGWSGGYDEKYNRIVITKQNSNYTFCLSFSFDHNIWVCQHDYFPNIYAYNRIGVFNFKNNDDNTFSLFKMNDNLAGLYHQQLTTNKPFSSYIEPIFSELFNINKIWASILWNTLSIDSNGNTDYDDTITHILVYNDNQCTGIIELVNGKNLINSIDSKRNLEYDWKFNQFRDLVINPRNEIISQLEGNVNTSNLDLDKAWFQKSKFISKFIAVRFIYDNQSGRRIHIQNVDVKAKKSNR